MENKKPLIFFGVYDDEFTSLLEHVRNSVDEQKIEVIKFSKIPQVNLKIQNDNQCLLISNDLVNILEILETNVIINKSNNNLIILLSKDTLDKVTQQKLENGGVQKIISGKYDNNEVFKAIHEYLKEMGTPRSDEDDELLKPKDQDKVVIKNNKSEAKEPLALKKDNVITTYMKGDVEPEDFTLKKSTFSKETELAGVSGAVKVEKVEGKLVGETDVEKIATTINSKITDDPVDEVKRSKVKGKNKKEVFHTYKYLIDQFKFDDSQEIVRSVNHFELAGRHLYKKQRSLEPFLPQTKVLEVLVKLSALYQSRVFSKNVFLSNFSLEIKRLFQGEMIVLEVKDKKLKDGFASADLNNFEMKNKWLYLKDKKYNAWLATTSDIWFGPSEEFEFHYLCSPLFFNDEVKALSFIILPTEVSKEDQLLIELFAATLSGLYSNIGSTDAAIRSRSLIIRVLYKLINFFRNLFNKEPIT